MRQKMLLIFFVFTSFGQSSSLFFQLVRGSLGVCGGAGLQPDVAARPMDRTREARGKRRGFSPGAAARHPRSARVHTDSFLHARVHKASPPKTFFFQVQPSLPELNSNFGNKFEFSLLTSNLLNPNF